MLTRMSGIWRLSALREERVDRLSPEAVIDIIQEIAPDLVLIDIELPVEIMAGRATGRPVALLNDMYSVWRRPGVPPLSSHIVPGVGWRGTPLWITVSWWGFRGWKWLQRMRFRITRVGLDRRSVLKAVADRTGFPLTDETSSGHWLIPFVYESIPTLTLNALEMEFPHQPLPHVTYVGPQLAERDTGGPPPVVPLRGDPLADVLARCNADPERKLIYCSFGAFGESDSSILQRVIEAVGEQPHWELVVGLGGRGQAELLASAPPNVHIYEWAPQLEVLRRADCAVHHAGTHSVNECVLAEVAMVLFPDDTLDHRGNAARVSFHGLGVVGDLRRDTPETIRQHIRRCLQSDEFRGNLVRMSASFRAYERTGAVEKVVEDLLVH